MKNLNPKILSAFCYLNMLGGQGNSRNREYNFFSNGKVNDDYVEDDFNLAVREAETAVDYFAVKDVFLCISFSTDLYSVDEKDLNQERQYLELNVKTQKWDYRTPDWGKDAEEFKDKIPDKEAEQEYFSQVLKELSKTKDFKQLHRDTMLNLQGFFDFLESLSEYGEYASNGGFDSYDGLSKGTEVFLRKKDDFTRKVEKAFNTPVLGKGFSSLKHDLI